MLGGNQAIKIPKNMRMKGYKFKLYHTKEQAEFIDNCIHGSRKVYNWALDREIEQYELFEAGKTDKSTLSVYDLDKLFTEFRNENEYIKKLPHNSCRSAIRRLVGAFKRFFAKQNRYPRHKDKKNLDGYSYTTRADRMYIEGDKIQIEGMPDKYIDIHFDCGLRRKKRNGDTYKFCNPVISKDKLGNYWISFTMKVKKELNYLSKNGFEMMKGKAIGIDLNKNDRFVLSNGDVYRAPSLEKIQRKINRIKRKLNKDLDRYRQIANEQGITNPDLEELYSNNHIKRLNLMRKEYKKIHNINKNFIYTTCKRIVELWPEYGFVMENIDNTNSIFDRHYMAKQMVFTNFYSIRIRMEQLCNNYGIPFKLADKEYPSTQICSNCGNKRKIYSNETYICKKCGTRINRHLNAAINLEKLAYAA